MAKRRSNGEGTLRLRADGRWEMTIMDGFRDDGKRRFKTFYGKTQKEVKAKAKGYRDAREAGLIVDANYLFPEWADIWYDHHRDNIAPTTLENYRYTLRILKEGFVRRRIADVKPYDIEMFLKKLRRDGRSDSCLAQCRGMLYQIFNKAEANDLIRKNPVRFAERCERPARCSARSASRRRRSPPSWSCCPMTEWAGVSGCFSAPVCGPKSFSHWSQGTSNRMVPASTFVKSST